MPALGNVSTIGLHQKAYGSFDRSAVNLFGAQVTASGGAVTVSLPRDVRDISCIGLAMTERAFANKGVGELSISITGASTEAQAQFLVGASVTIRVDDD